MESAIKKLNDTAVKNGLEVTIIEKNEQLGGRARVIKENGFTSYENDIEIIE